MRAARQLQRRPSSHIINTYIIGPGNIPNALARISACLIKQPRHPWIEFALAPYHLATQAKGSKPIRSSKVASSIISLTQKGKTARYNATQALTGAFTDFHIRSLVEPRSTKPWTQDSIETAFHLSHVKLPSYYTYCLFLSKRRLRIYHARFWKYPHPLAGCCQFSHALGGTWNEKRWWLKLLDPFLFCSFTFFLYSAACG